MIAYANPGEEKARKTDVRLRKKENVCMREIDVATNKWREWRR